MRAGHNPSWLVEGDVLVGLALGADYCAEHECGIEALRFALGVDGARRPYDHSPVKYEKPPGLARRLIDRNDSVRLYENGSEALLVGYDSWWFQRFDAMISTRGVVKAFKEGLPSDLHASRDLATAWDERSFGIYARGEHAARLRELAQAFEAKNAALWLGGGSSPFQNSSLILVIADRVKPEHAKMLEDADVDADKLEIAHRATGILERLAKAGRRYYACSPKWKHPDKTSIHPVMYWLNPVDQDFHNYGWFTVEELDQWIAGTGPIPKKLEAPQ